MKKKKYRSFTKARKFVRSLKLKNQKEWNEYCKSGKKPDDISLHPDRVYPKEFTILGDWLGTGRISNQKKSKSFLPPIEAKIEARKVAKKLGIKTMKDWEVACQSGKIPSTLPSSLFQVYAKRRRKK